MKTIIIILLFIAVLFALGYIALVGIAKAVSNLEEEERRQEDFFDIPRSHVRRVDDLKKENNIV
jgi:hypothetical protein